ncbi:helix-turn-helix domain-containing protein [uncultured Roseibium sp.]|uniref:helix-turn-helix domain-containing protein n=1 Tax=uncultured Roseibium sp. TaxID=1936171 RepID=UPI00263502B9|nr:helix-turn-helix domain-containing protein [uncultured Roseibium sp.]
MISIPISFLLASVFLGLGVLVFSRKVLPMRTRCLFLALFCVMSLEAVLVGLRFAFANYSFLPLQRVLPVWIAPLVFLSFTSLTVSPARLGKWFLVNGVISVGLSVALFFPVPFIGYIDAVIAASFSVYSVALIRLWSQGRDVFSQSPIELGALLSKFLLAAIAVMIATLIIDGLIAILFAQNRPDAAALAISFASLFFLIAAVTLIAASTKWKPGRSKTPESYATDEGKSRALVDEARTLHKDRGFAKDPQLSLTRLARRLSVPERDLSQAVNRILGMNVSQFVNSIRLEEAAERLKVSDEPVSSILEEVGFLTRSNFYREFQNQYGEAPGTYRKKVQSELSRSARSSS